MKAVILAGGLGSRLSEATDRIPKPMVEIGGRPILWHIMKIYAQHGVTEFVVCLGYKGYVVKEFFANYIMHTSDITFDLGERRAQYDRPQAEPWRVTLIDTGPETQTGGRLKRVAHALPPGEPFCLTYGDGVGDVDITASIAFHREHGRLATVTAVTPPGRFGVMRMEGAAVRRFEEKVDNADSRINGGFFVLQPGVLDYIEDDFTIWEQEPLRRLAEEDQLRAFVHDGFWQPMDTLRDNRQLEERWATGAAPWKTWR